MTTYLLVNFGGPRDLDEIPSFLEELLCDRDVIRTRFPPFFHNWMFRRIARKRTFKLRHEYEQMGGKSPIYFDTESIAKILSERLQSPVVAFHRYLPKTHTDALKKIEALKSKEIHVLPLFPQFCYATTGSIARFFSRSLSIDTIHKLRWIKSYAGHSAFIRSYQKRIADFLRESHLLEEETFLLFSAHGIPQSFISSGDIYESECNLSFQEIFKAFPKALGRLAYQSKFGRGEWLRPYTGEVCNTVLDWRQEKKNIVFVPLSFTSDHIETLVEIENLYLPVVVAQGLKAYRCPALNLEPYWIEALLEILQETNFCTNQTLIRSNG